MSTAIARVEHRSVKTGGKDEWFTPEVVLERVRRLGSISLDPCTDPSNPTRAHRFYTEADDGLAKPWTGGLVYWNPPYSNSTAWIEKCVAQWRAGHYEQSIGLLAARPGTGYWHNLVWPNFEAVAFWRGRITFVGAPNPAPFESALLYLGHNVDEFYNAMDGAAWVVVP